MAADMLDSVLKKEHEAAQNEASAELAAKDLIERARAEAQKKIKAAKAVCEENEKNQIGIAEADFEKLIAVSSTEAEKYVNGLKKNSELKLSEAVGLVKSIISD